MTAVIVTCGDLSARRPGEATRNHPLPAERLRRGAVSIFKHAGRRLARRDLVAGIVSRVRSGSDAGALNHGRSAPLNFSGSARVQACQQTPRCIRQALHLPRSFQNASASYEQEIIGAFGNVRKAFGEIRNVEC